MSYFVGMDIHKVPVVYHVLDPDGAMLDKGTVRSTRRSLEGWAQTLPKPWVGAMETTLFTQHVYQTLLPYAERLLVGDSARIRAMNPSKHKNDARDAHFLAKLARADLVPVVYVLTPEEYELRQVLRYRALLVREAVRMRNKSAGLLMECGVEYNKRRLHGNKYFNALIEDLEDVPDTIVGLLKQSHALGDLFYRSQKKLIDALSRHPALYLRVERLMTIKAVGVITALTWALEIINPDRFSSIAKGVSYCGLCAAENESAGKHRHGRLSSRCNPFLRTVLLEAAKLAPRHNQQLADLYAHKLEHSDENLATIAVARKLVAWILAIDKRKEVFAVRSN
jgi:transposase